MGKLSKVAVQFLGLSGGRYSSYYLGDWEKENTYNWSLKSGGLGWCQKTPPPRESQCCKLQNPFCMFLEITITSTLLILFVSSSIPKFPSLYNENGNFLHLKYQHSEKKKYVLPLTK
jgi:hypothetical protein